MRLFPATARRRLAALCAVGALGVGAVTSPFAHADTQHLRHEQAQAQHSVKNAQADLDEASRQSRHAYDALQSARGALRSARHDLRSARAHARRAHDRFRQVKRQLARAQVRLGLAKTNLARGQQAVTDQHRELVNTVTSMYEQGDPQLVGFLSLLNSQTPADLTAKNDNNNLVLGSQDQALDGLKASEVLLQVQTQELTKARDQVAKKRAAGPRQPAAQASLQAGRRGRQGARRPDRPRPCARASSSRAVRTPTTSRSWPAPALAPPASTVS